MLQPQLDLATLVKAPALAEAAGLGPRHPCDWSTTELCCFHSKLIPTTISENKLCQKRRLSELQTAAIL